MDLKKKKKKESFKLKKGIGQLTTWRFCYCQLYHYESRRKSDYNGNVS